MVPNCIRPDQKGLDRGAHDIIGASDQIGVYIWDFLTVTQPSSDVSRACVPCPFAAIPTITTVTPALWLARFAHLSGVGEKIHGL